MSCTELHDMAGLLQATTDYYEKTELCAEVALLCSLHDQQTLRYFTRVALDNCQRKQ
jgi:hypothetical protein